MFGHSWSWSDISPDRIRVTTQLQERNSQFSTELCWKLPPDQLTRDNYGFR